MRLCLVTAFTLALAVTTRPLSAQSISPIQKSSTESAPSPGIAPAIPAAEARLDSALARRDRAALEDLVAVPFAWIHAGDGSVTQRDVWLANAAQGTALTGQRSLRSEHQPALAIYGGPGTRGPHTAVRVASVRLRDPAGTRETWLRQTRVFIQGADGAWLLASGQGTLMYDGPPLDTALHARYGGTYVIAPGRMLTLTWEDGALVATYPNGARLQVFLASPTEETVRTVGGPHLRFTLGPDGRPLAATLVRGDQEIWRATRNTP